MSTTDGPVYLDSDDKAASTFKITTSGERVDLSNMTGKKRMELIAEGEIPMESFVSPSNMPGKQLKILRERFAKNMEASLNKGKENLPDYQVGDLIIFKDVSYEVKGVDPVKGLKITKETDKGPKNVWVQPTKVEKVKDDDGPGDEGRSEEAIKE